MLYVLYYYNSDRTIFYFLSRSKVVVVTGGFYLTYAW